MKNAYHCMAIDEHRAQFPATLWTGSSAPDQTIEQVWFTGTHGDFGGGTPVGGGVDDTTRLCDITLGYMAAKALALGLTFDPDSLAGFATLPAKYSLDKIGETWKPVDGPEHFRPIAADAHVSNSVAVRVQYGLTYTPQNLTIEGGALDSGYTQVSIVDTNAF